MEQYFTSKSIVVDEIFFTGDFRHAVKQKDQPINVVAQNAVDFLTYISKCVLKDKSNIYKHIHIVPGNHDLNRGDTKILGRIYKKYDLNNANFKEKINDKQTSIGYLKSRFDFFKECASLLKCSVWNSFDDGEIHRVDDVCGYSVVYLNSAIASGLKNERGKLYIGRQYLNAALKKARDLHPDKPIIVLSHNILEHIEKNERIRIKNFINDLQSTVIWLCGDVHNTEYNNSYNVVYVTTGCLIKENGTNASFIVGDLSESLIFDAHCFDSENSDWEPREALTKRINDSVPETLKPRKKNITVKNNLPPRNMYFTGRDNLLATMDKNFRQKKVIKICQNLSGLGGIGKTQLAIEYAYRYGGNYCDAVWFVESENVTSVYNSFYKFVKQFNIFLPDNPNVEELQKSIKEWLSKHNDWLLIFDNLEFYDDIHNYLPNPLNGHCIITTRKAHLPFCSLVEVKEFNLEEAVLFLKNRIPNYGENGDMCYDDFEAKAPILAERLGYLPLALEQAGAYISCVKCSFSKYLELLEQFGLNVFTESEKYSKPQLYEKVVTTTWKISFNNIINLSAKQLFNLCAYLAPDNIPVNLFIETRHNLPSPLREDIANELCKNRIVTELREYSLTSGNAEYISIHRLVQEVVRNANDKIQLGKNMF